MGWSYVVFVEDGLVSLFGFSADEFFLAFGEYFEPFLCCL